MYSTKVYPTLDRHWPLMWAWKWACRSRFLETSSLLARSLLPAAAFALAVAVALSCCYCSTVAVVAAVAVAADFAVVVAVAVALATLSLIHISEPTRPY